MTDFVFTMIVTLRNANAVLATWSGHFRKGYIQPQMQNMFITLHVLCQFHVPQCGQQTENKAGGRNQCDCHRRCFHILSLTYNGGTP